MNALPGSNPGIPTKSLRQDFPRMPFIANTSAVFLSIPC